MEGSLREIFTPLFAYGLLFAQTPALQRRSFQHIREDVNRLLENLRAYRRGVSREDSYEKACFAVIAWIDELVLRCTLKINPDLAESWGNSPLQYERYQTRAAGEEFFEELGQLGPAQRNVREIYHLCLCLGFCGEYAGEPQRLADIRRELARDLVQQLPTPLFDRSDIQRRSDEPFVPEPYQVQAIPVEEITSRDWTELWRYAALILAGLAVVLLLVMSLPFWWPSSKPPTIDSIRLRLQGFSCSQFTTIKINPDGLVLLQGHVADESQRRDVQLQVENMSGVTRADVSALQIIPHPFCDVVELLTPIQQQGNNGGYGLRIQPDKGCNAQYFQETTSTSSSADSIIVQVTADKPLQYVYIDYYTALDPQGLKPPSVAHMFPNEEHPDPYVKGINSIIVGGPDSTLEWKIEPPSGMELLTVVASARPLLDSRSEESEPVVAYLPNLQRALGNRQGNEIAADYCFIMVK